MRKRIFSLIVFICLSFSLYTIVFSQNNSKIIEVVFNDIVLRGIKSIDSNEEIFYYNNKLYAPVSMVVKMIGGEGLLDKEKNEIFLRNYKDFPECDSRKGEIFVYGFINYINYEKKQIEIEQYFDDNSVTVSSKLNVKEDVVILLERNEKRMNLDFTDLKAGDNVGLILNAHDEIRGIILIK